MKKIDPMTKNLIPELNSSELVYCDTLKNKKQYLNAINSLRALNLEQHEDPPKNWDTLAALDILKNEPLLTDENYILDAGGEFYSVILKHLSSFGFKKLYCLNLAFTKQECEDNITYIPGDITRTDFSDNTFKVITCLSVIEHGVCINSFFSEMQRILQQSGLLIISTDYWVDPVETFDKKAYGVPIKVFSKKEILEVIEIAKEYGLELVGNVNLECDQKTINWEGLDFTFIYFTFRKK